MLFVFRTTIVLGFLKTDRCEGFNELADPPLLETASYQRQNEFINKPKKRTISRAKGNKDDTDIILSAACASASAITQKQKR
jgi:hypothetical protein